MIYIYREFYIYIFSFSYYCVNSKLTYIYWILFLFLLQGEAKCRKLHKVCYAITKIPVLVQLTFWNHLSAFRSKPSVYSKPRTAFCSRYTTIFVENEFWHFIGVEFNTVMRMIIFLHFVNFQSCRELLIYENLIEKQEIR